VEHHKLSFKATFVWVSTGRLLLVLVSTEQAFALFKVYKLPSSCARFSKELARFGRARHIRKHLHAVGLRHPRQPILYFHERDGTPSSDSLQGRPLVALLARRSHLAIVAAATIAGRGKSPKVASSRSSRMHSVLTPLPPPETSRGCYTNVRRRGTHPYLDGGMPSLCGQRPYDPPRRGRGPTQPHVCNIPGPGGRAIPRVHLPVERTSHRERPGYKESEPGWCREEDWRRHLDLRYQPHRWYPREGHQQHGLRSLPFSRHLHQSRDQPARSILAKDVKGSVCEPKKWTRRRGRLAGALVGRRYRDTIQRYAIMTLHPSRHNIQRLILEQLSRIPKSLFNKDVDDARRPNNFALFKSRDRENTTSCWL
jgi:hypothetical protein